MIPTTCDACGATATLADGARCDCGEPLWIDTDPHDFDWSAVTDAPGMWRYEALLPYASPGGVADAAGGTPLVRAPRLDAFAGVRVHVKDEGENPTGSFKDRGSAVGAAHARAAGVDLGTVSHGNMAMSVAANAASADVDCVVCVPADVPRERLGLIAQYDPTLLQIDGDYGRLYERSLALGRDHGVRFVNSDTPLRVAGQKTTTLELCEAFAPDVPDAIVLPVSSGGHASGAWKALRELRAAGVVDRLPALYFVQAAACAPIAAADARGDDVVTPVDEGGDTIAYSIANADPPSGTRALAAARDTGGRVVAVTDDEIRTAQRAFASRAGFSVETASATTLAGVRNLAAAGDLTAADDVVLVVTGTGFKERRTGSDAGDPETVALSALGTRLDAVGE